MPDIRTRLMTRLRELRKRHGLTQETFSEISGFSYKFYQLIEIGRKNDLRLSSLERLAKAYRIEVHQLLAPEMPKTHFPKGRVKPDKEASKRRCRTRVREWAKQRKTPLSTAEPG